MRRPQTYFDIYSLASKQVGYFSNCCGLWKPFGNSDHGVMYVPGGAGTGGGTGGPPGLPSAPRTEVGPLNGLRSPCGCGMTVEVKLGPGSLPLFCKLDSGKSCSCDEVSCKFNKK